jgi:hypothetical protein
MMNHLGFAINLVPQLPCEISCFLVAGHLWSPVTYLWTTITPGDERGRAGKLASWQGPLKFTIPSNHTYIHIHYA